MSRLIDITGHRFGRLVVIEPSKNIATKKSKKWICKCDCGVVKEIQSSALRLGKSRSCGCLKDEKTSTRFKKHGQSNSLLYKIWSSMKARCYRTTSKDYRSYGGRGVKITDEWREDFSIFYEWAINNGYKEHYTIERIDPDGNYSPENCCWIENEKQALNRRNSRFYEFNGLSLSARDWSQRLNINYNTLRDKLQKGNSIEQIIKERILC